MTKEEVKKCWSKDDAPETVEIRDHKTETEVVVESMYEAPPLNLAILLKLSKLFGTDKFETSEFSFRGCETCNYGSAYGHTFTFQKSDIGIYNIPLSAME